MKTIKVIDGKITIPKKFNLSKHKRKLHIRTAWYSELQRLDKDLWRVTSQVWFRNKELGDKPFIPEGYIEFDGIRYKVIEEK
jgi:hypothetical protein